MRVLALAPYPAEAPSTRFRVAQFVPALAGLGVELHLHPFFDGPAYRAARGGGAPLLGAVARGFERLRSALDRALYDVALVQRGVAPFLDRPVLGDLMSRGLPIVYDFDDAVFLPQEGGRPWVERLRASRTTTAAWCRAAAVILAGNDFLAAFAREAVAGDRAERVRLLPTVVDTERFRPASQGREPQRPTLGWVGSASTLRYLERMAPVLRRLQERVECGLLVVAGDTPPQLPGVDFAYEAWRPADEARYFQEMDVGLYPLDDTPWARGKCGFKAIQYLACGVPCVASPVGVLEQIVRPDETGLHATTEAEWIDACARLLRDPEARDRMGEEGRRRVQETYSVERAAPLLADALRSAAPATR